MILELDPEAVALDKVPHLVMDADDSQFVALMKVAAGRNLKGHSIRKEPDDR